MTSVLYADGAERRWCLMKWNMNSKAYLERELYIGIFSMMLGIFFLYAPDRNRDLYRVYPKTVFWGLILSGMVMVFHTVFIKGDNNIGKARIKGFELLLMAILLMSRPLMGILGLYTTVFLISVLVSLLIKKDKSLVSAGKTLVFNLILMGILYGAFAVLLKVNAPAAWLI